MESSQCKIEYVKVTNEGLIGKSDVGYIQEQNR